ncbi:MAG: hypothetical protein Kow0059_03950 [Candidatus Sumerlaeia bacterium]
MIASLLHSSGGRRAALIGLILFSGGTTALMAHNLKGNPDAIDRLIVFETAQDFLSGFYSSSEPFSGDAPPGVQLKRNPSGIFSRSGYYESPEISPGFLFKEALPSWNIELPPGTGYAIQLCVKGPTGTWSSWYYLGGYKVLWEIPFKKVTENVHGRIDVDHWVGFGAVPKIKFRVWLFTASDRRSPVLRRFFLHLRGYPEDNPDYKMENEGEEGAQAKMGIGDLPPSVHLDVPWRSQAILGKELKSQACCPTSAAMLLEFAGHDVTTTDVARRTFDLESAMYGVWPRASQVLSEFGLRAYVRRYRTLDEARRTLADGQPIIISIKAQPGQLPEAPYRRTNGHLLVLTGYDGQDWFIVNDPATSDPARGRQVRYSAAGLEDVWIDNGGVAIIAEPPSHARRRISSQPADGDSD